MFLSATELDTVEHVDNGNILNYSNLTDTPGLQLVKESIKDLSVQ